MGLYGGDGALLYIVFIISDRRSLFSYNVLCMCDVYVTSGLVFFLHFMSQSIAFSVSNKVLTTNTQFK